MNTAELVIIGILSALAIAGTVLWALASIERWRADRRTITPQPPVASEPCELCKAALGVTLVAVRVKHGPTWLELVCHGCAVEGAAAGRHTIVIPNARRVQR